MKTNHGRGYKGTRDKVNVLSTYATDFSALADRKVSSKAVGIPDTERQARRFRAGAKKFVRSRFRFHEDAALRKMITDGDY